MLTYADRAARGLLSSAVAFESDPFGNPGSRFALAGFTTGTDIGTSLTSPVGTRPWGLRRARPARAGRTLAPWTYDESRQLAVDVDGVPLIDSAVHGDPTAETTSTTDGEDRPSSEDWDND